MKTGDIFYTQENNENSKVLNYHVYKVLRYDEANEGVHVKVYQSTTELPTIDTIKDLRLFAMHIPMSIHSFKGPILLTNEEVKDEELEGYKEYLRNVNYAQYLRETGQNVDEIISKANEHFRNAIKFHDENKFDEAIEEYSKAIELFPTFFEAIDNRGYCYLDKGEYQKSINDFEDSIRVNGHTAITDSCIGECYFKMGDKENALKWFLAAKEFAPDNETLKKYIDFLQSEKS